MQQAMQRVEKECNDSQKKKFSALFSLLSEDPDVMNGGSNQRQATKRDGSGRDGGDVRDRSTSLASNNGKKRTVGNQGTHSTTNNLDDPPAHSSGERKKMPIRNAKVI